MNSEDMFERLMTYIADLNSEIRQRDIKLEIMATEKTRLEIDVRTQRSQIEAMRVPAPPTAQNPDEQPF